MYIDAGTGGATVFWHFSNKHLNTYTHIHYFWFEINICMDSHQHNKKRKHNLTKVFKMLFKQWAKIGIGFSCFVFSGVLCEKLLKQFKHIGIWLGIRNMSQEFYITEIRIELFQKAVLISLCRNAIFPKLSIDTYSTSQRFGNTYSFIGFLYFC